jgi:hypothetical protein
VRSHLMARHRECSRRIIRQVRRSSARLGDHQGQDYDMKHNVPLSDSIAAKYLQRKAEDGLVLANWLWLSF